MAKMYGIEIKNLKTFKGHEFEKCFQGSVYYSGRRCGFWSQDSWGGPDNYDFDIHILDEAFEKYKKNSTFEHKEYMELGMLLGDLAELLGKEKQYKSWAKDGVKYMIEVGNDYSYTLAGVKQKSSVQPTLQKYKNMTAGNVYSKVYSGLDDFIIN